MVRNNTYPNAYVDSSRGDFVIHKREETYIFNQCMVYIIKQIAFPLKHLQYNELNINITLRPVRELYTIRDIAVCAVTIL